ncbi:MAG TPA: thiamine pyrophosphate-dependent enzyme [Thermoanaerobaculia bacterium]|nr:thiamine pyrophosphate-dependent enzyme [Thermoanaerobaculia bacterium]
MAITSSETTSTGRGVLLQRFVAFVAERCPFALRHSVEIFESVLLKRGDPGRDTAAIDALREPLRAALAHKLAAPLFEAKQVLTGNLPETTPGVSVPNRIEVEVSRFLDECDGFLRRESLAASFSAEERREILRGMLLTRATDNRLKLFFSGGDVRHGNSSFQGKGFRSLGQEAIYAAAMRLKRGPMYRDEDSSWHGDVVAPLIRDLGVALAMNPSPEAVRMVLSAQMGKEGPPMNGKDLHIGDLSWGVLPASAPLGISTLTAAGMAMAFHRDGSGRVALSFIGEGGSSLGEWHEAINLCAARKLPAIFCIQNNQTALSTPLGEQSAVRVFADKAIGYGVPGITVDGTDADAVAAAFAWAAERAREGKGPTLIELVAMRMCGHAHHDDMLYLGRDPQPGWEYPALTEQGYADRDAYAFWSARDPIARYAARLIEEEIISADDVDRWKRDCLGIVETEARKVIDAPWPSGEAAGVGVLANESPRQRIEILDDPNRQRIETLPLPALDAGLPYDPKGRTFLEAVMLGIGDALRNDPRTFVYGEDVGGKYGNAFLLLRPLLPEFGNRIMNSTLAEGGVLGVCVGAALAGQRPIGEIQFNDFVATGFNQLVNNAAKIRYRWGGGVPMVVRMPWGGLRHAGPYHSQNTEGWFYRTPGLKIVCPSTPQDARALMHAAVEDPDPVLYYEHIALYRDPKIKQMLPDEMPELIPIGKAALRREGNDLAIISYGAFVHTAMRVAGRLAIDGIEAAVLDLRSVAPLDRDAILALARNCSRVLIIHEDTRTGSIGESIAAIIQEEAFEYLDAPVRIIGALDTPVPYSPPLEAVFLPSDEEIERAAKLLVGY